MCMRPERGPLRVHVVYSIIWHFNSNGRVISNSKKENKHVPGLYSFTFFSPCQCVCLCNRAPGVLPAVAQSLPATCPPLTAVQSTLRLPRLRHCPLCTAAPPHGRPVPGRYTGQPGIAKRQGCHFVHKVTSDGEE